MSKDALNTNGNPLDLVKPIDERALNNQAPPTGQRVILQDKSGIIHQHFHEDRCDRAVRFGRILDAEIEWIEKFTSHAPTVGNHYESILRDLLTEYLPSSVCVGTGFVYDSMRQKCSPQIDILVYKDSQQSPIHRRGEFVIVDPNSVIGVCEVKKELTTSDLSSCIRKMINHNLGQRSTRPYGVQRMGVFAFKCRTSTQKLAEKIRDEVNTFLNSFRTSNRRKEQAFILMFQMTLPAIYLRDREEYISVDVRVDQDNPLHARIFVEVLQGAGSNGISPLLNSMNTQSKHGDPVFRDFVSSYLVEVVKELPVECPVVLRRRISSAELVRRFPDGKEILSDQSVRGNQPYGAIISSFIDIDAYTSLHTLMNEESVHWEYWDKK